MSEPTSSLPPLLASIRKKGKGEERTMQAAICPITLRTIFPNSNPTTMPPHPHRLNTELVISLPVVMSVVGIDIGNNTLAWE
jgi:hypothetical protein